VAKDLLGGTIYQVNHQYRAPAKTGIWKRSFHRVPNEYFGPEGSSHVIFYHEDCTDPEALLMRARKGVNFSRKPDFTSYYTYVNRYDWLYHHTGEFSVLKGDPLGVFFVDEVWAKQLKAKAETLREEVKDPCGKYRDLGGPDHFHNKTGEILKTLGGNTIPVESLQKDHDGHGGVDLLPGEDDKIVGLYDSTFMGEKFLESGSEWIVGRLVFDEDRKLEAFVASDMETGPL